MKRSAQLKALVSSSLNVAPDWHAENVAKGWWDRPEIFQDQTGFVRAKAGLILSEASEAFEGFRKNSYDDHLPMFKAEAVEIADVVIRVIDMIGYILGDKERLFELADASLDYKAFDNPEFETCDKADMPFGCFSDIGQEIYNAFGFVTNEEQKIMSLIHILGSSVVWFNMSFPDLDLWEVILQKREYNAKRADHTKKVRSEVGGKRF